MSLPRDHRDPEPPLSDDALWPPGEGAAKTAIQRFSSLQALPVRAAIVDGDGVIIDVNEAWRAFGRGAGLRTPAFGIGSRYQTFCDDDARARLLRDELQDLLDGRLDLLTHSYPCHGPERPCWYLLVGVPLARDARAGAALLHIDITALLPAAAGDLPPLRLRNTAPASMLDAVAAVVREAVRDSVTALHAPPAAEAAAAVQADSDLAQLATRLSGRQREVFALLGAGKTNQEIATVLALSPNTVKLHVSAILRRLDLHSRTQAAVLAARLWPDGP